MVRGKVRENLTKDSILSRIDEYSIYRFYVGEDFPLGKMMHSPMPGRKDNHPSFLIGCRAGFLYHIDFADSRLRGNCFQFVMQKEMLPNYNSVLQKIEKDFNLGITTSPIEDYTRPVFNALPLVESEQKFFQVQYTSRMTGEELRYWREYYITPEELEENEIYAVRKWWIDRQLMPMKKGELCFGYKQDSFWKICRPTVGKPRKWLSNIPIDTIEGTGKIRVAKLGIITKSRKDRIILQKFVPQVVSVQNESLSALPPDKSQKMKGNWDTVYLNYDNDEPGKRNSWIVTWEYGFKHLNVPDSYLEEGIKDFADLCRAYGPDAVYKYLQSKDIIK